MRRLFAVLPAPAPLRAVIDPKILEANGYSDERLRDAFTAPDPSEKVRRLLDLNSSRIQQAYNHTIRNARFYWAAEQAFDVTQRQLSSTITQGLINKNLTGDALIGELKGMGLTDMLTPIFDKETKRPLLGPDGKQMQKLNIPVFWQVYVPLVQAYVKARAAKLFDTRYKHPLYKYTPAAASPKNRARCEIITSRVQRMAEEMGYVAEERQCIFQMLMHGQCVSFPLEPWYQERQMRFVEGGGMEEYVLREGIRWTTPHPTRMYIDGAHRPQTLNTDTGVQYMLYWDVVRYMDVLNAGLWVDDDHGSQVVPGALDWLDWPAHTVYRQLYPCTVTMPSSLWAENRVSAVDRQNDQFRYTQDVADQGMTLVNMFAKLVPSEWDLFEYDYPVWFRFVQALETSVIKVEPLAYTPAVIYQYDADQNRYRTPGLAYELIPFQDQLGNILSQMLISLRRNLANVVFYDQNNTKPEVVELIRNLGSQLYLGLNLVPVDRVENAMAGVRADTDLFQPMTFPNVALSDSMAAISTVLNLLERSLGFSAQEVGAAATHEQSATEVKIADQHVSTRLTLTSSFVDDAVMARKRILYDGFMAYGSDEVVEEVGELNGVTRAAMQQLGFEVDSDGSDGATVIGPKSALVLTSFASNREGVLSSSDAQMAREMIQMIQMLASNPATAQMVGAETIMKWMKRVMEYAGLEGELALPEMAGAAADGFEQRVDKATAPQMEQLGQALRTGLIDPMKADMQTLAQQIQMVAQVLGQITGQPIPLPQPAPQAAPPATEAQPPVPDAVQPQPEAVAAPAPMG